MSFETNLEKPNNLAAEPTPRPRSISAETALQREAMREKLRDPSFLPTHEDIMEAFGPESDRDGVAYKIWEDFCRKGPRPVYELLNKEHLEAFSDYLVDRLNQLGATTERPVKILEVCAGNGRLSHFLRQMLERKAPGLTQVIATDSGESNLVPDFPVALAPHNQALTQQAPRIVICSWMPMMLDLTADFRKTTSVDEYILIGETDESISGDEIETWGMVNADETPRYALEGFERRDLKELSKLQTCRTDTPGHWFHSETVSFRRKH